MLVAFAHTGGLIGAEVGIAGGTAVLAQKVLEAIFGDQAVRDDGGQGARAPAGAGATSCYAAERAFARGPGRVATAGDQAERLADAAAAVKAVR